MEAQASEVDVVVAVVAEVEGNQPIRFDLTANVPDNNSSDEEDTAPGADDGSADDMEVSTSDDGLDLDDG